MKLISSKVFLLTLAVIICNLSFSQDKRPNPVFTADSLKSGNSKDVFLNFFQLAFENLAGSRKEFKFSANPFAVMMRADPKLAIDTSYVKYTGLRKWNFAVGLRVDSSFKFNGFTSGVTYSIINKRDYKEYRNFLEFQQLVRVREQEFFAMTDSVTGAVSNLNINGDTTLAKKLHEQWAALSQRTSLTLDKVDKDVLHILDSLADKLVTINKFIDDKEKINFRTKMVDLYREEREIFKKRLLWTVDIADTTYQNQFFFSNIVFSTQVLKGFSKPLSRSDIELDLRAAYNIVDDTLRAGRDLGRGILNFDGSVNYVRRHPSTDISFFEFKAGASFKRVFSGLYAAERKEIFALKGTIRFRLYEEIWIPLEFEYDPKTGNVFGFLNLRVNFTALRAAIEKNLNSR